MSMKIYRKLKFRKYRLRKVNKSHYRHQLQHFPYLEFRYMCKKFYAENVSYDNLETAEHLANNWSNTKTLDKELTGECIATLNLTVLILFLTFCHSP